MESLSAERIDQFIEERVEKGIAERAEALAEKRARERLAESLDRQRALLCRQTARKLDGSTAARLAALLEGIEDPERLAETGEQVIDCATGAELLARAERSAGWG